MKNILPAIMTVLALGLSAMYFTSAEPAVNADDKQNEATAGVLVNVVLRLKEVEKKLKIKVPTEQEIEIKTKP